MARQQTNFNPAVKEFEAYLDFSGGQNSAVSNERLNDNEFPLMLNVDNTGRGSAKTRYGRVDRGGPKRLLGSTVSKGQGLFNFYRANVAEPVLIGAAHGQLYLMRRPVALGTIEKINIVDGTDTDFRFQTQLPIEAAQYRDTLYIATGTKLVQLTYESNLYKAKTVEPYQPTVQEAIYIGTNGLAPDPDAYIQDGTGTLDVTGIKPASRNGSVNQDINMTAYINRPAGDSGTIDYKWEYKRSSETTFPTTPFKDFTANAKTQAIKFDQPTKYDIKVTVRKTGTTTPTKEYLLTNFQVNATENPPNMSMVGIQKCRKIILHWDRLLMSGDDTNPFQMYISHLQNPRYFPVSNTINFDFGKQEPITAVVRFQDMLVVFTRSTIQTLLGKSVDDYQRYLIHDGLGCVAGRTATVVGNNVLFLSHDGVYALKPNPYRLETMNVGRIDQPIQREIDPAQTDACAVVHDSQYWLCFPSKKEIYRYYFERKVWTKDTSENLDIAQFLLSADDVFNLTSEGRVYQHDRTVFMDAGIPYDMVIESKFYDLSASFNNKKLKRLYILARHEKEYDVNMFVTVKADSALAITPDSGTINRDDENGWSWQVVTAPNFEFLRGTTFGTWIVGDSPFGDIELSVQRASVRGKCRRVKFSVRTSSTEPCEMYGFAFQFKLKKI